MVNEKPFTETAQQSPQTIRCMFIAGSNSVNAYKLLNIGNNQLASQQITGSTDAY
jgi:hypothetical protein